MSETSMKTFDDYQEKASSFVVAEASPNERAFGLLAEAGEVAGAFQRFFRGDYDSETFGAKLFYELGDCLWYLSQVAMDNGWKLSEIAEKNIEKLESRKLRNLLIGEGSNR